MSNFIFFLTILFPFLSYSMEPKNFIKELIGCSESSLSSDLINGETEEESKNRLFREQIGRIFQPLETKYGQLTVNNNNGSLYLNGHCLVGVNNEHPKHDYRCNCAIFAVSPNKTKIVFESIHPVTRFVDELCTINLSGNKADIMVHYLDATFPEAAVEINSKSIPTYEANGYKKIQSLINWQGGATGKYLYKKLFAYLAISNIGTIALVNKNITTGTSNAMSQDAAIELLNPEVKKRTSLYVFSSALYSVLGMRFNSQDTKLFVHMHDKTHNTSTVIKFDIQQ